MRCEYCFHHCILDEGQIGFCKGRIGQKGKIVSNNYGYLTAMALDPIEKKPLKEFYPGSKILSIGSFGCNLRCPFCQNYQISQYDLKDKCRYFTPEQIISEAKNLIPNGNIGIAFTYNEPLISPEFVKDTACLAKKNNLKTVLVTNGCFSLEALKMVSPYIDAMNIDLKGFSREYFSYIGANLKMTEDFIKEAHKTSHIELTTLIVPNHNDSLSDMEKECKFISSINKDIPLHLTRYFPRYHEKKEMTKISLINELYSIAKKHLVHVYLGNI